MGKQLLISIRVTIILLLIVSGVYPLVVWGLAQAAFHHQANGSLVKDSHGQVVGSELLAQGFTQPGYFHPRPSAAGSGYDPTESGGTNLGPTSDKLINGIHKKLANGKDDPSNFDGVKDLAVAYRQENNLAANTPVPVDAVTRSGSGLDPDISLANAQIQAARVARTRGISSGDLQAIIDQNTHSSFGTSRVNVLRINLALDQKYPQKPSKP